LKFKYNFEKTKKTNVERKIDEIDDDYYCLTTLNGKGFDEIESSRAIDFLFLFLLVIKFYQFLLEPVTCGELFLR
jgi:hypothetical protein